MALNYWIKERHNPQNGITYTKYGQMTVKEARKCENTLYGSNIMHRFARKKEYLEFITKLENQNIRLRERF